MPENYRQRLFVIFLLAQLIWFSPSTASAAAGEGIKTYYIRYDVKSSKNRIIKDNLLMIPAKDDFRGENFSVFSTTGVISAAPKDLKVSIEERIRHNALKTILVDFGLKSVKTKDHDTVISYEGLITTPLNILKHTYDEKQNQYRYEVQIEFSPIAFPDRWKMNHMKHKIKQVMDDFFQLFQ